MCSMKSATRSRLRTVAAGIAFAVLVATRSGDPATFHAPRGPAAIVWQLDSLTTIGGHRVTLVGNPRVIDTEVGRAIEFDGTRDGLFLDVNPLAGLDRFTVEVLFAPASDGAEEQRF